MHYERLAGSSDQFIPFKMTIVVCHFCHLSIFLLFFLQNPIFCRLVFQSWCSLRSKVHSAVIYVFVCFYMVCIQVWISESSQLIDIEIFVIFCNGQIQPIIQWQQPPNFDRKNPNVYCTSNANGETKSHKVLIQQKMRNFSSISSIKNNKINNNVAEDAMVQLVR